MKHLELISEWRNSGRAKNSESERRRNRDILQTERSVQERSQDK
jgi:hypothetical protein